VHVNVLDFKNDWSLPGPVVNPGNLVKLRPLQLVSIKTARSLFLRSKQGVFYVEIFYFYTVLFQKCTFLRAFRTMFFSELAVLVAPLFVKIRRNYNNKLHHERHEGEDILLTANGKNIIVSKKVELNVGD
jgi:hypothetical protein